MYLNKESTSIKAEVLNKQINNKPDKNTMYYWYASNNIMETQGAYDGKVLHGKYYVYFLSHNLREKGDFKNGLKNGEWISWYENGKIQEITHWKNGYKTSDYKLFNEKGQLIVKARFKKNRLHGRMTTYDGDNAVSIKKYKKGKESKLRAKKEKKQLNIFRKKKKDINSEVESQKIKKKISFPLKKKKVKKDSKPKNRNENNFSKKV